jgi:molybdopterin-synthase adenylyltransferase
MVTQSSVEDAQRAVEGLGLVQDPRRVAAFRSRSAAIEGEAAVEGRTVTLRIEVDCAPSASLPRFYLRPWDALGFIPHVCPPEGFVCFTDAEGVVVNRREPLRVVAEGFRRALCLLADGITGRNHADFADEFETYWSWLDGGRSAYCLIEPGDTVERVSVTVERGPESRALFVAADDAQLASFLNGNPEPSWRTQPGIYVPLESGTRVTPPRPGAPFWTVEQARGILWAGLSSGNRDRLVELTRTERRDTEFVVVGLPRPSSGTTLFGLQFDGTDRRYPLRPWGSAKGVTPLNLTRVDRGYLTARSGASTELGRKRVLLVGCGSVGGHLAFELARAGVADLTLVDDDRIKPENWYRHVLGRGYLNQLKVVALKHALEAQLPYLRVTAVDKTIQAALAEGAVRLSQFDLVVLALGNPTVELDINERLHTLVAGRPAALFTWLEPFGIGGHALLMGSGQATGCFECLYSPVGDDDETLENRASFAAPGQTFAKSLTGCAGLYTPYGSIDAVRTAALAARLAVDALVGREAGSPLVSWKGSPDDFVRAGYRLSSRFGMSEEALDRQRYAYRSDRCRVCGTERRAA